MEDIVVKYIAEVEEYNKQMESMTEATKTTQGATDDLQKSTDNLTTDTKTSAKAIGTLSKGLKNSTNVFTKYGNILQGLRGPVKLFAHLLGVSAQSADQLRIGLEHALQAIGAATGKTKEATSATKAGTDAIKAETTAQRILNAVKSAGLPIIGLAIAAISLAAVGVYKLITSLKGESEAMKKVNVDIANYAQAHKDAEKSLRDLRLEAARLSGNFKAENIRLVEVIQEFDDKRTALEDDFNKKRAAVQKDFDAGQFNNYAEFKRAIHKLDKEEAKLSIQLEKAADSAFNNAAKLAANDKKELEKKRLEDLSELRADAIEDDQEREIAQVKAGFKERLKDAGNQTELWKALVDAQERAIEEIREKYRGIADNKRKAANRKIIADNEKIFNEALKQFEALRKLGQASESPIEKESREHEARLKAAGLFGRSIESLTEFEHGQLLKEEQDYQDKLNIIIQAALDFQQKIRDDAFALEQKEQKEQDDANLNTRSKAIAETDRLAKKGNKDAIEILRERAKQNTDEGRKAAITLEEIDKELNDKRIDDAKMVSDAVFQAYQDSFDKRQELRDEEIEKQETNIDRQADLAARGLANTLAFEEKRAAELRRQQQKEVEQAKKVKLLETFLNSLAEYSKSDPKTALNKALLQVALATAATAVFAEEGGIIGEIGERSNMSRKHKGGGDVLLHAQTGEGILSRKEMANLGHRNFHLLKDVARFPIRNDVFSMPDIAMSGGVALSNADVVKELKSLQKIVKDKRETHYDLKQNGDYMVTQIESGVRNIIKGKLPKPRFGRA